MNPIHIVLVKGHMLPVAHSALGHNSETEQQTGVAALFLHHTNTKVWAFPLGSGVMEPAVLSEL